MFQAIYSYFFGETDTNLSLEQARTILNDAATIGDNLETENTTSAQSQDTNVTIHNVGVITARNDNKYTIDDTYTYECSDLDANEGDRVSYVVYIVDRKAFVASANVIESDWDAIPENVKSCWCRRTLTVKVVQRNLREIVVHPGTIKIDLNKVRSEFIPIVGDWLQMDAKCDLDENVSDLTGQVLEVTRIKPLRWKRTLGSVKRWDGNTETGLIDRDVFFNFDALSCGYSPRVGDQVTVEAIESEQEFCTWRAIKVVPQTGLKNNEKVQMEPAFEREVDGIEIGGDIAVEFEKPQESRTFCLNVRNKSDVEVVLKAAEFLNQNGQCSFENTYKNCVIKPNHVVEIACKCTSRNYGRNKELLLLTLDDHLIGRYITITLKPPTEHTHNTLYTANNTRLSFQNRQRHHHYNNKHGKREFLHGQNFVRSPAFIARRLRHYEVPEKLWNIYLEFSHDQPLFSEALLQAKPCLNKLDFHCYEDYFHTLLFLEEMESVIAMRKYDQEKACFITNGEYLMLEIEHLSEKRPSIIVGDKVVASDPFNCSGTEFEGVVYKVGAKHVYLKFGAVFHETYKGEDYSVRVIASRTQLRKCHYAISLAMRNLGRDLLFPTKLQLKPAQFNLIAETTRKSYQNKHNVKIEWYDKSLNHYQKQAVRNILLAEAKPLPYCIFGPPGTGKTVTVIETILQILTHLPDARILVGTPSNSAADIIASRLIDSGVLKPGELIRFVAYRCVTEDSIPVKLVPYCATADITAEGSDHHKTSSTLKNGLKLGVSCSVIGRHRVTVSTASNVGTLFNMNFPRGHFTHIILDEAGHLLEPEAMIPLSFLDVSSGQAILAGDPLQLGPIVISKQANEYGLSESYLERLMNRFPYTRDPLGFPESGGYDPRLVTKLVYNYRSLPDILTIPSKLFYNSELTATISSENSEEARLLDKLKEVLPYVEGKSVSSMVFHGVEGENCQMPDSPSWFNPTEASQVFMYVNDFYRLGLRAEDIGIISPYSKQIQQIRSILAEAEFEIPKAGTVEEFQGQEFKVVILSVVRSMENFVAADLQHNLGFIFCPRRLNVAITRAQVLLLIVGNPNILALDPHWRSVLMYCVERGAYCGCPLNM